MATTDPNFQRYLMFSIRVFQLSGGEWGVGLHSKNRGIIWRWDSGIKHRPTIIHWHPPHCGNDTCASPCKHHLANL